MEEESTSFMGWSIRGKDMKQEPDHAYMMYLDGNKRNEILSLIKSEISSLTDIDIDKYLEGEGEFYKTTLLCNTPYCITFNILLSDDTFNLLRAYQVDGRRKDAIKVIWGAEEEDDTFSSSEDILTQYI